MRLPEDKRHLFQEPWGRLFGNSEEAFDYLGSLEYEEIISVGDEVSAKLLQGGFNPEMVIVDLKVERRAARKGVRETIENYPVPKVEVDNPSGEISEELWNTVKTVETPVKIIVEGEEDLATLPATLFAPKGSVVIYGQPGEGLVLIEVDEEKKEEFRNLLRHFEGRLELSD